MSSSASGREPVERLAEEFVDRYRRGERPALSEYVRRHPHLAEQIRALFPALVMMEDLGSVEEGPEPERPAEGSETPPDTLGEYRLLRKVAEGGMGVVYEAVQQPLGRRVALKLLPFRRLGSPTYLERFRREAKAAARLHHTNIVPVFGTGEADGFHYYAMQFIQGQGLDVVLAEVRRLREREPGGTEAYVSPPELKASLAASLVAGDFPPRAPREAVPEGETLSDPPAPTGETRPASLSQQGEASYFRGVAQLGLQVAEALAYAHRQGIVHRDIKPSNLLLDHQGVVWVTDFGLAKEEEVDGLTSPGDVVGTPAYMAPERFRGQCDPRSDVYSLGVTLYEMLTLRPAFHDTNRARLIDRVLREEPARPRAAHPRLPRDLETVVLKAMAKDPRDRYPSAEALAEDLQRYLTDRPVLARRTGPVERLWRWARRNPVVASLTLAIGLLVLTLAGGSLVAAVWLGEKAWVAENARNQAVENLWHSYLAQARAERWSGRVGGRLNGLDAIRRAAAIRPSPELRDEALAAMTRLDLRPAERWPRDDGAQTFYSPDLGLLAYGDTGGRIHIRRTSDNKEVATLPGPRVQAWIVKFSPDGRFLAANYHPSGSNDKHVWVWDWRNGRAVLRVPRGRSNTFAFSPDGRRFALASLEGLLRLYELPGGQEVARANVEATGYGLAFHPDGDRVAVSCLNRRRVLIWSWAARKVTRTLPHPAEVRGVAWHPEGRQLAVACHDYQVHLWDGRTYARAGTLAGHESEVVSVSYSPDGNLLASHAWDTTARLWDPWLKRQLLTVRGAYPSFSQEWRRLGVAANGAAVYELVGGEEFRTLNDHYRGPHKRPHKACFLDGTRLLASAECDAVRIWDLSVDRVVAELPVKDALELLRHPTDGSLVTCSHAGIQVWPVRIIDRGVRVRIGPPSRIDLGLGATAVGPMCFDRDGLALIANVASGRRAAVIDWGSRAVKFLPFAHLGGFASSLSPAGRLLATGNYRGKDVKVWEVATGRLVATLPASGKSNVARFSPDGRLLAFSGVEGYQVWKVGAWDRPLFDLPRERGSGFAFSPDSRVLAIGNDPVVELIDLATGQPAARLEYPGSYLAGGLSFSPDGRLLLAIHGPIHLMRIWDLARIRTSLAELGLPDSLPLDPPPMVPTPPRPIRVEVVTSAAADWQGRALRFLRGAWERLPDRPPGP